MRSRVSKALVLLLCLLGTPGAKCDGAACGSVVDIDDGSALVFAWGRKRISAA